MKVNGSSWKFAAIFFTGIIIAAQLLFIIHWRWRYWQSQRWKEELPANWVAIEDISDGHFYPLPSKGPTLAIVNGTSALLPKPVLQELICSREQKVQHGCYAIVDGPSPSGSGFGRFLLMEPMAQLTMAVASLKFPIHYNFTRENARQWPVLPDRVPMELQKVLIAQPFITQTFGPSLAPHKVPEGNKRRILSLGLRGSIVNNFFANLSNKYDVTVVEAEPALRYVAEKWFGFEETEHHRIFIENPAFYITARAHLIENPNTVKVPKRFDFILVDVCHGLGSKTPGKCLVNEFEDEKMVAALSKNLMDNGTIVLHFFTTMSSKSADVPQQHQMANHEHEIMGLYKKYFKNCYFLSAAPDLVLTCTRRASITRAAYILGFRKLPKELQLFQGNKEPKFFLDLEAL